MPHAIRIEPGATVRLAGLEADQDGGLSKSSARTRLTELSEELGELQELLFAAHRHAVLVVLQGMDTSGKDGTITHVMSGVNPQGCRVESFKAPTEEERSHDFLWRIHRVTPPLGILTIFNRSHYEDVLVVRVQDLVPRAVWEPRFERIVEFERQLVDSGTIVLKFFLHISREEQAERLLAREKDETKAWKLSAGDWRERQRWDAYVQAYEDAIARTSTAHAPWYVVPADKKWFRNLAIAETIVDVLDDRRDEWNGVLRDTARAKLAELKAMRAVDRSA